MRAPLGLLFAGLPSVAPCSSLDGCGGEARRAANVAIIGAGAAGSSAAYHLQQYAAREGLSVNVTIFEKTDRVGGRAVTVNALDDPALPVEQGASIFITANHILYNASRDFGLPLTEASGADSTAIWDGERIVFQSSEGGTAWWWDAIRLWLRYGSAPFRAAGLVRSVVATFLKLYEPPHFPFRSLTQRVGELGLDRMTGLTGQQFLAEYKLDGDFAAEVMQAATRVNYAANLAYIHGLEAAVSLATEGAVAVAGGNWQIFDGMARASGATLLRNTSVAAISRDVGDATPCAPPRYLLSTRAAGQAATAGAFDSVIIAAPWQFSGIDAGRGVLAQPIAAVPYVKLHVTVFASPLRLRPGFVGLEPGATAPGNVYTTLARGETPKQGAAGVGRTGFYSVSTLRSVDNARTRRREYVYKIFSAEAVTPALLSDMLGAAVPAAFVGDAVSWFRPHWFHSYPVELPRVAFQDPVVGRGLYYTSGVESFISTMETSALMGMNVARLVADDLAAREPAACPAGPDEL